MCLCGSAKKFKVCCKKNYSKRNWNGTALYNSGKYHQALKATRSHITWYRLCHMAHTANFYKAKPSAAQTLMDTDIEALSELIGLLMNCYQFCGIINEYPNVLTSITNAIDHKKWGEKVDYHRCAFLYLGKGNGIKAKSIANKYQWENINDPDFLTLYIDLYQDELNQIDLVGAAKRVVDLTSSEAEKLQYRCMEGIQYCLMKDIRKGASIVLNAIEKYEKLPDEEKSQYGRMRLANAYSHLGLLLNDQKLLIKAIENLSDEIECDEYSDAGLAQLYIEQGECYLSLKEYDKSEAAFENSQQLNKSALADIFLSRALTANNKQDEARDLLINIDTSEISNPNLFDMAISYSQLALKTKTKQDIEVALEKIKSIQTGDALFINYIKELTIELYELKSSVKSTTKAETALERLNRYIQLKPNVMGLGFDLNAIIDDFIKNK